MLQSVCKELLSSTYSEQVSHFILPALAYGKQPFPFVDLLHALLPVFEETEQTPPDVIDPLQAGPKHQRAESKLTVEPSLWLLSSVLHLGQNHIGQYFRSFYHKN